MRINSNNKFLNQSKNNFQKALCCKCNQKDQIIVEILRFAHDVIIIIIIIITGFIYCRYLPFQALPDSDREKKMYKSIKVVQLNKKCKKCKRNTKTCNDMKYHEIDIE